MKLTEEQRALVAGKGLEAARWQVSLFTRRFGLDADQRDDAMGVASEALCRIVRSWRPDGGRSWFTFASAGVRMYLGKWWRYEGTVKSFTPAGQPAIKAQMVPLDFLREVSASASPEAERVDAERAVVAMAECSTAPNVEAWLRVDSGSAGVAEIARERGVSTQAVSQQVLKVRARARVWATGEAA